MERELERIARVCFEQALGEMFPEEQVALRLDDNPPDYSFDLGGTTFAVEATSTHDLVRVADKKRQPGKSAEAAAKEIEMQLRDACSQRGLPRGFYVVHMGIPLCKSRERDSITEPALEYIRDTRDSDGADSRDIWPAPKRLPGGFEYQLRDNPIAKIRKVSMRRDLVQVIQPPRAAWIGVAEDEAVGMLNRVLKQKADTLRKHDTPKPWVLLVLHRHAFVAHTYYRERLSGLDGLSAFHSVFVARNDQEGYLLSSHWHS